MSSSEIESRLTQPTYVIRRKVFKLLGAAFQIYDGANHEILYSEQKAFKLREDIRLYGDEGRSEELLHIQARSIVDFSAAYDVVDVARGERVGALKRRGFTSLVRDEWIVTDADDRDVARIQEQSLPLALARRFGSYAVFALVAATMFLRSQAVADVFNLVWVALVALGLVFALVPQVYVGTVGGDREVVRLRRHVNPFVQKLTLQFSHDADGLIDRRLGLAAGILLIAIEGRQSD